LVAKRISQFNTSDDFFGWKSDCREIAPGVKRAGVLRDQTSPAGIGQFAAMQSVASTLGIELIRRKIAIVRESPRGTFDCHLSCGRVLLDANGVTVARNKATVSLPRAHPTIQVARSRPSTEPPSEPSMTAEPPLSARMVGNGSGGSRHFYRHSSRGYGLLCASLEQVRR